MRTIYPFLFIIFLSCSPKTNPYNYPTFHKKGVVNCVIEIPAGTNKKIEYQKKSNTFAIDQKNGVDRQIDFLPYPANYGFIPSSYSDPAKGGDGDALDIIVIAETMKSGSIVPCIPIGIFKLIDNGEEDYKIVCIPLEKHKRMITAKNFSELNQNYPEIIRLLQIWFLNYDSSDTLSSNGWGSEDEAMRLIMESTKGTL